MEDESRPSKVQLRLASYREESWTPEETCCLSYSSERPSTYASVDNSPCKYIIIIIIIIRIVT